MFTGLVEEKGELRARTPRRPGARLRVRCAMGPLVLGESIACDGVCLTVAAILPDGFEADASAETLALTTLGALPPGAPLNLERATPLGGRMGGHIVSGHVDGLGRVVEVKPLGDARHVTFTMPGELAPLVAKKGSVAVNGVSLTVNEVTLERFSVVLVPHTRDKTGLDALAPGAAVNLEADVLARYVARQLATRGGEGATDAGGARDDAAWLDRLNRAGYT